MNQLQQFLQAILTNPWLLGIWIVLVLIALGILIYDLRQHNPGIMPLMKAVWFLTVLYSGPVGLQSITTPGASRSAATRSGGGASAPTRTATPAVVPAK
jgi:undecaprenyl pyrophosphate phosphatase UppP